MRRALVVLFLPLLLLAPRGLRGQDRGGAQLEGFVAQVGRLWEAENAAGLAALAPSQGGVVLEVGGEAAGPVPERHVAAALRALFADRESVSLRPTRITVSGGQPLQGFGELAWVSRSRGVTVPQTSTIYVGVVWEQGGWRIRELRVLP